MENKTNESKSNLPEIGTKEFNQMCEKHFGGSIIPEKSTRELAMLWWNRYGLTLKDQFSEKHFNGRPAFSLTGREIEQIWLKENVNYQIPDTEFVMKDSYKPNQKQFKELSENHFWTYFSKFKHQDKVKMYEMLKSWYETEGNMPY